jgi:putative dimethyl sulfoxide reductase chaperone
VTAADGDRHRRLARSRAYALLGDLLRRGLRPEHLAVVGEIGELARVLRLPFDEDAEGAAHYALFGHEVFPFESAFVALDGQLGGAAAAAVQRRYVAAGFAPDAASDAPDHVGHELAFLGYLSRLEHASSGTPARAGLWRGALASFLDAHLLAWLPALSTAVRMRAEPFWAAVVELALNLAVSHRAELAGDEAVGAEWGSALPLEPPPLPDLEDSTTSVRDVARALLVPARSGLLLARAELAAVARKLGVPRGFGDRREMLAALFVGAGEGGCLPELLASLEAAVVEWETVLDEYETLWPTLRLAPWRARLAGSRRLLGALAVGSQRVAVTVSAQPSISVCTRD